ncbi:MAG: hypothetical protein RKE49_06540 [Oceanicaulis sp.]
MIARLFLAAALGLCHGAPHADPLGFRSAWRATVEAALSKDYEAGLRSGERALALADAPAERRQAHHMLADLNARLGRWDAAQRHARAARDTATARPFTLQHPASAPEARIAEFIDRVASETSP